MNRQSESIRLNKHIAGQMAIGRRQADEYIASGRVTLNGVTATVGDRVVPMVDTVSVDGKVLKTAIGTEKTYLLFNKPVGYVCSRKQQGDTPTIYALLPKNLHHLKSVGRLDKESSGLLLLTNDGNFAHRMTHPSFRKVKKYEVRLHKKLEPLHHQMINDHGITLDDGLSRFDVEQLGDDNRYLVTMHEGRNRQIRRTFGSLGYMVKALHRISFGPFGLDTLTEGQFKKIDV